MAVVVTPPGGFDQMLTVGRVFAPLRSCMDVCDVVVVDLSGVASVTSAAVAEILVIFKMANESGRPLKLVSREDASQVRETFHTLRLDQLLPMHNTVSEALRGS
jgi:anti-anti-sigma regulatory factor